MFVQALVDTWKRLRDLGWLQERDYANKQAMNTVTGERIVAERTDFVNISFQYNLQTYDIYQSTTGTGALGHSSARATISTGTGVGLASIESKDPIRYVTGHEVSCEGTIVFAPPEENKKQKFGIGDDVDGFAGVGYNGLAFGVWLRTVDDGEVHMPVTIGGLNTDKFNIYKITLGWYGILPLQFSYFNAATKEWTVFYSYDKINQSQFTHLKNPALPMRISCERTSGTGVDTPMYTSSWRGGIAGKIGSGVLADRKWMIKTKKTIVGTNIPIFSIRNNTNFQGQKNHVRLRIGTFTASTDGNKAVEFDIFKGGTLTGGTWTAYDTVNSVSDYNNTATSYTPPADGRSGGTVLGKIDRDRINLLGGDVVIPLYPGEELHVVGTTSSTNEVVLYFRHVEEF